MTDFIFVEVIHLSLVVRKVKATTNLTETLRDYFTRTSNSGKKRVLLTEHPSSFIFSPDQNLILKIEHFRYWLIFQFANNLIC